MRIMMLNTQQNIKQMGMWDIFILYKFRKAQKGKGKERALHKQINTYTNIYIHRVREKHSRDIKFTY
jgi:hypothetical protein